MNIKLNSGFIKKILKKISRISETALLDFSLIYRKYINKDIAPSEILIRLSDRNPEIYINILKYIPFYIDLYRRIKSYPIAYIIKSKEFYESTFFIKKGVLIPRPETEMLVDLSICFALILKINKTDKKFYFFEDSINELEYLHILNLKEDLVKYLGRQRQDISLQINFCELCSGSGAVSISIFKKLEEYGIKTSFISIDVSQKAISVAKKNTKLILGKKVKSLKFIRKDIFKFDIYKFHFKNFNSCTGLSSNPESNVNIRNHIKINDFNYRKDESLFDIIIANPPYIRLEDFEKLKKEVKKYEPKRALVAGKDQNLFYKRILDIANKNLKKNGFIALEVSDSIHAKEVAKIFNEYNFRSTIIKDFQNIGRVVIGQRNDYESSKS